MDDANVIAVDAFLRSLQDRLCATIESADGGAGFREDAWRRAEGGGGRTRVLKDGAVFEQGGVNFSRVHGERMPPSASAQQPELAEAFVDWHWECPSCCIHAIPTYRPRT